jgi:thiol-disulfide isomerase/thioredoxin
MPDHAKPVSDRLGLALLVVVLAFVAWRIVRVSDLTPPVAAGTPMPPLEVEGWLNLADGVEFDPRGELVVIDCWATWCGPCMADLPKLAMIVSDYRRRGVKFVSITSETAADVPEIEAVIKRTPGFDWPVAYGGRHIHNQLAVGGIPTLVLYGRDGKARWSLTGSGLYGLTEALDAALAEEPAEADPAPAPPAA